MKRPVLILSIAIVLIALLQGVSAKVFEKSFNVKKLISSESSEAEQDEESMLFWPTSIDSDSEGNIYVLDVITHNIKKYDIKGNLVLQFGRKGLGPGEFRFGKNTRCQIAISKDDYVFVLEQGHNRLQVFDAMGKYVTGRKLEHRRLYNSISTDSRGFIYLSAFIERDSEDTIYVYRFNGKKIEFVRSFGKQPFNIKITEAKKLSRFQLMVLRGVTFSFLTNDAEDNLYQVFKMYPYIRKFDSDGKFLKGKMIPLRGLERIKLPMKKHLSSLENPTTVNPEEIGSYRKILFSLGIDNDYVNDRLYISLYMNSAVLALDYNLNLQGAYYPTDIFTASAEALADRRFKSKLLPPSSSFCFDNIFSRFLIANQGTGECYIAYVDKIVK